MRNLRAITLASLAVLGCGDTTAENAAGSGGSGGAGAGGSSTTDGTTSSSDRSSSANASSSSGATTHLPPLACRPGEVALLGTGLEHVVQFFGDGETWSSPIDAGDYGRRASFVDAEGAFDALATGTPTASFDRSSDAATFTRLPVDDWAPSDLIGATPLAGTPAAPAALDPATRLVFALDLPSLAWTQIGAFDGDFYPSGVVTDPAGATTVVGFGDGSKLCAATAPLGEAFGAKSCTGVSEVFLCGEIRCDGPKVVALPNGDLVVAHFTESRTFAVRRRRGETWSQPVFATVTPSTLSFAMTPTTSGDVVIVAGFGEQMSFLRFGSDDELQGPFGLGVDAETGAAFAAAPGICGDDALAAFTRYHPKGGGYSTVVARIRGDAGEVASELPQGKGDYGPTVTLATRATSGA